MGHRNRPWRLVCRRRPYCSDSARKADTNDASLSTLQSTSLTNLAANQAEHDRPTNDDRLARSKVQGRKEAGRRRRMQSVQWGRVVKSVTSELERTTFDESKLLRADQGSRPRQDASADAFTGFIDLVCRVRERRVTINNFKLLGHRVQLFDV
jgi:hypothetical protein